MKKTFKAITAVLAIFAIVFSFSACSKKGKDLIGNWKSSVSEIAYVFNDDGTYSYYISTLKLDGQYKIEDNKLILKLDTTNEEKEFNYKVKKSVLYLYTDKQKMEEGIILDSVEEISMATIDEYLDKFKPGKNKKEITVNQKDKNKK